MLFAYPWQKRPSDRARDLSHPQIKKKQKAKAAQPSDIARGAAELTYNFLLLYFAGMGKGSAKRAAGWAVSDVTYRPFEDIFGGEEGYKKQQGFSGFLRLGLKRYFTAFYSSLSLSGLYDFFRLFAGG